MNTIQKIGIISQAGLIAVKNKVNTAFTKDLKKPNYADLQACMEVLLPKLKELNLGLTFKLNNEGFHLIVIDLEKNLEDFNYLAASVEKPQNLSTQQFGSWITYIKRYFICFVFNILADEDDDGNIASGIQEVKIIEKKEEIDYNKVKEIMKEKNMDTNEAFKEVYNRDPNVSEKMKLLNINNNNN